MAKQVTVPGPGQINMVGEGTVVEGTFRAGGDVRVSGKLVGKLFVDGKVIVTQEGIVDGEITAASADIAGSVIGEIAVKDRLVLKNTAAVEGNVRASRLVIEEGAVFGGKCHMGQLNAIKDAEKGQSPAKVHEDKAPVANGLSPRVPSHV